MTEFNKNNPLTGRRLGNYKIESLIAEGGMSSVYEGVHMLLGRRVAVKQLNPLLEQKDGIKERLKNEAVTLSKLKHPHIVTIYDYIECELGTFIIEELIKGIPLNEYLKNESGPIPEPKAIKLMLQMLDAVGYMHSKNIIHRDIKPGNFIITPDNEIKMLDFGIAQIMGESPHITQSGTKVGTALYMSPQQVKGQPLDRRTDIYSLGVTFFHMVTGQHPYSSKLTEYEIYNKIVNEPMIEPMSIYKGVSAQMQEIIFKAVAKKPLDRYQDCGQIKRDLLTIAKTYENKTENSNTQIFDFTPEGRQQKAPIWKNAIMMGLVAFFMILITVSVFTLGNQDQMYVIADNAKLYDGDSITAKALDNLNYGETLKILTDKPAVTSDGTTWITGVSSRGIKGFIQKNFVAPAKIYQQINSMFANRNAIEKTPDGYKMVLWKYFVENKYFRNSSSEWKIYGDSFNELEFSGICTGNFNGNNILDYACIIRNKSDKTCKLLMFFDESSENIAIDFDNEIKIRTIQKGENGGGWYLGNVYTRTMSNGTKYDVNKYEFLPSDGILIFDIEKETNTICILNAEENKIVLVNQPK
ncbi:MAG: protein kinase [Bacteroidales bacterium]|nr:protein kinase [Bacteroidales bacterium]